MNNTPDGERPAKSEPKNATSSMKRLCSIADVEPNKPHLAYIKRKGFLIYLEGEHAHIVGHTCPHGNGSLTDGSVVHDGIICPLHHARFSLIDGRVTSPPSLDGIDVFESAIVDGEIYVGKRRDASKVAMEAREETNENQFAIGTSKTTRTSSNRTAIIVGGGIAALTSSESLRTHGFRGRVVILSEEHSPPYDRTRLSKDPQPLLEKAQTPIRDPMYLESIGIEFVPDTRLIRIDRTKQTVISSDDVAYRYDHLLIATGRRAAPPPFAVLNDSTVFTIRSLSDRKRLEATLQPTGSAGASALRVVVVGAGFLGLELTAMLRTRGLEVSIVAPETIPLLPVLGEEIGRRLMDIHRKSNVDFHMHCTAESYDHTANILYLSDGTSIQTDIVISATGSIPNSDILSEEGLCTIGAAVPVDERYRTADRRIYAFGDVALASSGIPFLRLPAEHWVSAARQGFEVGRSICGVVPGAKDIPFFWSEQYDHLLQSVGTPIRGAVRTVISDDQESSILISYSIDDRVIGVAGIDVAPALVKAEALLREGQHIRTGDISTLA